MPALRAVGRRRLEGLALGAARRIRRPHLNLVRAGGRRPAVDPLAPGVGGDRVGEGRLSPGAVVHPHLHRLHADVLFPGHPRDGDGASGDRCSGKRSVDAGGELDRAFRIPAPRGPVALVFGELGHLELDHPFGRRDVAVKTGHDHPHREAVFERQRLAIHSHGEQGVRAGILQYRQRRARGESVDARGEHHVGPRLRHRLCEQFANRIAQPEGSADEVAAHLIRHAGEGREVLLERLRQKLGEAQRHLVLHHSGDLERPFVRIDRRYLQRRVDSIEVCVWGDERRDSGHIDRGSGWHRIRGHSGLRQRDLGADRGDPVRGRVDQPCPGARDDGCGAGDDREGEEAAPLERWPGTRTGPGATRSGSGGRNGRYRRDGAGNGGGTLPATEPLDREAKNHHSGDTADDGGDPVKSGGPRAGDHRDERDHTTDADHDHAERRPARFEHAGGGRDHDDEDAHEREKRRFVSGAEDRDHELLDSRRGEVDDERTDREQRAPGGTDNERDHLGDPEHDRRGHHSGERRPPADRAGCETGDRPDVDTHAGTTARAEGVPSAGLGGRNTSKRHPPGTFCTTTRPR